MLLSVDANLIGGTMNETYAIDGSNNLDQINGQSSEAKEETPVKTKSIPIGRVASPIRNESTSIRFYFWVPHNCIVEKTQLVWTESQMGSRRIRFYGVVDEVFRRSRKQNMTEEVDAFDGELDYEPPYGVEGVTFAEVSILAYDPPVFTPPLEQSLVYLSGKPEAARAYGYNEMVDIVRLDGRDFEQNWQLPIGLLRNGGESTVGSAYIDLRDLSGDRAGHLNVTGQAGRGTKSSFLLVVVRSLMEFARHWDTGDPARRPFSIRPIVFNVKGNDLMYIDMPNRDMNERHRDIWQQMGIAPEPFVRAWFFAPCQVAGRGDVNRGVPRVLRPVPSADRQTQTYYWTLADVIRFGLWNYLFSEASQQSETMMSLADHILGLIAVEHPLNDEYPGGLQLAQQLPLPYTGQTPVPQSFEELRVWLLNALNDDQHPVRGGRVHTFATIRALLSRIGLVLGTDGLSIFSMDSGLGRPLRVLGSGTSDPLVIDIAALPAELRRFVVAAVLDQVKTHQISERRQPGQVYFLVLDELGVYAPRGARDPITRLFEHVAAQLRSQGIILLGAQQQASDVSETIFGNSQIKILGATSPVELESSTWNRLLTPPQKARALMLQPDEKMVLTAHGWMNVVMPFPAWAMKESEAEIAPPSLNSSDSPNEIGTVPLNLPQ
jgi:hypothetical protein